jgi:PilZ domain
MRQNAQAQERRTGSRVPFAAQVMFLVGERAWFADVVDLSEGGCGVFRPKQCAVAVGNVARLCFFQSAGVPAVVVSARIARLTDRHVGFEYHELQSVPPGEN